jgi:hypothetical protein
MIDLEACQRAQMRINTQIVKALEDAGVISRQEFSARLRASAERLPPGDEQSYIREMAQGLIDGLPPEMTVIDGGKK